MVTAYGNYIFLVCITVVPYDTKQKQPPRWRQGAESRDAPHPMMAKQATVTGYRHFKTVPNQHINPHQRIDVEKFVEVGKPPCEGGNGKSIATRTRAKQPPP